MKFCTSQSFSGPLANSRKNTLKKAHGVMQIVYTACVLHHDDLATHFFGAPTKTMTHFRTKEWAFQSDPFMARLSLNDMH
jgi:hypothetical protein